MSRRTLLILFFIGFAGANGVVAGYLWGRLAAPGAISTGGPPPPGGNHPPGGHIPPGMQPSEASPGGVSGGPCGTYETNPSWHRGDPPQRPIVPPHSIISKPISIGRLTNGMLMLGLEGLALTQAQLSSLKALLRQYNSACSNITSALLGIAAALPKGTLATINQYPDPELADNEPGGPRLDEYTSFIIKTLRARVGPVQKAKAVKNRVAQVYANRFGTIGGLAGMMQQRGDDIEIPQAKQILSQSLLLQDAITMQFTLRQHITAIFNASQLALIYRQPNEEEANNSKLLLHWLQ